MADSDMIDFHEVLAQLQVSEVELQDLIARGDLKAFRSGGTMKFRAEDLNAIKQERETEPTIIIPPSGENVPLDSGPIALDLGDTGVGIGAGMAVEAESVPDFGDDLGVVGINLDVGLDEGSGIIPDLSPETVEPISIDSQLNMDTEMGIDSGFDLGGGDDLLMNDAPMDPGLEILPTEDSGSAEEITIIAPDVVGGETGMEPTILDDMGMGTEAEITIVDEEAAVPPEVLGEQTPMSPDRQSVSGRVSSVRTRAVHEQISGHPVMSAFMVLTAAVTLFVFSILFVVLWHGTGRQTLSRGGFERFVPSYLADLEKDAETWALPQTEDGGNVDVGDPADAADPADADAADPAADGS